MDERVNDLLLAFVDFLYAIMFGLIVAKLFDGILLEPVAFAHKAKSSLLVMGVFYFLLWDWLHGRLLTLRNPFPSYRRFFIEVFIACCGYGAAVRALEGRISFLCRIALILVLGALWARLTIQDYPESEDRYELSVIIGLRLVMAGIITVSWVFWERRAGLRVNFPPNTNLGGAWMGGSILLRTNHPAPAWS